MQIGLQWLVLLAEEFYAEYGILQFGWLGFGGWNNFRQLTAFLAVKDTLLV